MKNLDTDRKNKKNLKVKAQNISGFLLIDFFQSYL